MRPSRFFLSILLALAALLSAGGCGDDAPLTPSDAMTSAEAAGVTTATVLCLQTGFPGSAVAMVSSPRAPASPGVQSGGFELTCPSVGVVPSPGALQITLSYNPPCTSELDQELHAGTVRFDLTSSDRSYQVTFASYMTGGYLVTGGMGGSVADSAATLTLTRLSLAGPAGNILADGSFTGAWHAYGTPVDLADDSWEIRGGATVVYIDQKTYTVTVADDRPVTFTGSCRWPVSGRITIRKGSSPLVTTLDFGDGSCDDAATLTIAGQTTTIHLPDGRQGA